MTQERQQKSYQPFQKSDYQETSSQEVKAPEGIDSIIGEIDKAVLEEIDKEVTKSNLSETFKQREGQ